MAFSRDQKVMAVDYTRLSKEISYALRHHPEAYDLKPDRQGRVRIDHLIAALRKNVRWQGVSGDDIKHIIEHSDKRRFEISDGMIRALYGHSTPQKIERQPQAPPEILYHGTARRFLDGIFENGLLPGGRQYVHLSVDMETALQVGKRRGGKPILLEIEAGRAWTDGILFYRGNDMIWLSGSIPSF